MMYSNVNPAELYPNTTWEKIESRYIKATDTGQDAGITGGNNTINLTKANLPAEKLQISQFNLTRGTMNITGAFPTDEYLIKNLSPTGAHYRDETVTTLQRSSGGQNGKGLLRFSASRAWTGESSQASPYTENMGQGTSINIEPYYITLHLWKRTN